jgi:hypothetical protein
VLTIWVPRKVPSSGARSEERANAVTAVRLRKVSCKHEIAVETFFGANGT